MNHIKEVIAEKIKLGELRPRPRWEFWLIEGAIWVCAALSIAAGAIATSLFIRQVVIADWGIAKELGRAPAIHYLMIFPLHWLAVAAGLTVLTAVLFYHTRRGYRFAWFLVVGAIVVSSVIGGGLLWQFEAARRIDRVMAPLLPPQIGHLDRQANLWGRPERGLLGGLITSRISGRSEFRLQAFDGQNWVVRSEAPEAQFELFVHEGMPVKLRGERSGPAEFVAREIRPGEPPLPLELPPGRPWR